jgi:hypothetical protein
VSGACSCTAVSLSARQAQTDLSSAADDCNDCTLLESSANVDVAAALSYKLETPHARRAALHDLPFH